MKKLLAITLLATIATAAAAAVGPMSFLTNQGTHNGQLVCQYNVVDASLLLAVNPATNKLTLVFTGGACPINFSVVK